MNAQIQISSDFQKPRTLQWGLISGVVTLLFCFACAGPATQVLDPSADDSLGGTGTESGDVLAMADKISRGITHSLREKNPAARIAITPIQNASRFRIDTDLIRKKLTRDLVKSSEGATYLARDALPYTNAERSEKRQGIYTMSKNQKMLGADYFLVGQMRGLSKTADKGMSDYLLYSFELVDAETGAILWADDFETKKRSSTDVVYR